MNLKLKHLKRIIISIIIIIFVIQLSKIDNSDTKFTLEKIQMGFKGEIINMYDNGFMVEIAGHDHKEEWANAKIVCTSMADLVELIQEATELERS